jgi:tellurium resistance protein TerD
MSGQPSNLESLIHSLNKNLYPQGIKVANYRLKEECLQLILEGLDTPQKEQVKSVIKRVLLNHKSSEFSSIHIYGKKIDSDTLEWQDKFSSIPPRETIAEKSTTIITSVNVTEELNQITEITEDTLFNEGEVLALAVQAKKLHETTQCRLFTCIAILRDTDNDLQSAIEIMTAKGLVKIPEESEINKQNAPTTEKRIAGEVDSDVSCPKCHCHRVVANKKGFGAGKAFVGTLLLGIPGLLGGFIGSDRVQITCLKCGYSWTPGPS